MRAYGPLTVGTGTLTVGSCRRWTYAAYRPGRHLRCIIRCRNLRVEPTAYATHIPTHEPCWQHIDSAACSQWVPKTPHHTLALWQKVDSGCESSQSNFQRRCRPRQNLGAVRVCNVVGGGGVLLAATPQSTFSPSSPPPTPADARWPYLWFVACMRIASMHSCWSRVTSY